MLRNRSEGQGSGVFRTCPVLRSMRWQGGIAQVVGTGQVPAGSVTREAGHGRAETRTLKAAHVSGLDFAHACQAIKITRWRKDTATGKVSRETAPIRRSVADLAGERRSC